MAGAATNPDPTAFRYAAAQVAHCLNATKRLDGANYVLWGGREGYETLLNTDMKRELDQLGRFMNLVVEHKYAIGFEGTLLIEPKPMEPTKHQYDYDVATVYSFLQKYGLENEIKVNIEVNHATLSGHDFHHEVATAVNNGIFGSIDANAGDDRLGWDLDRFPGSVEHMTLGMLEILRGGGFTTGGLMFDCKLRRQSVSRDDLFIAHIGAMDVMARSLLAAASIIEDGELDARHRCRSLREAGTRAGSARREGVVAADARRAGWPTTSSRRTRADAKSSSRVSSPGTSNAFALTRKRRPMASVVLDKITKVYDNGFQAIHDLSLRIEDGEFLVLVGPSGCGKSTALRMIAGLETITDGVMRIGDRIVNDIAPKDRDIAMVFQNYALYPHMTVHENIGFALKLAKTRKPDIDAEVRKAAEVLELTQLLDRKPGQLSGGQRQRVAMGRAIVRQPAAFLMDEPLSNLDAKLRVQMRAEIASLQRSLGVTTVYVTHDQVEAMTMGDRVAVLKDGYLQQVDTPQNLYDHPTNVFVAAFIGSPSMNLYDAVVTISGDGGTIQLGSQQLHSGPRVARRPTRAARATTRVPIVLGVRPEDFEDAAMVAGARRRMRC